MAAECRNCGEELKTTFADLGMSPLANNYLTAEDLSAAERFFPLHAFVCDNCLLVQLEEFESPDVIFSDYAYFSSWSTSWLKHCEEFATAIADDLRLDRKNKVVEIASNDGYLLRFFAAREIPVLGIEPAENVAASAIAAGVPTVVEFFGTELATRLAPEHRADLIVANNVLAHVPDIHDFVEGVRFLLKEDGLVTMEFPHLLRLIEDVQFDTIYHEHFSYLSLRVVQEIFRAHGLDVIDVRELNTHGGSLRVYARHAGTLEPTAKVEAVVAREEQAGLTDIATYERFSETVAVEKRSILKTLMDIKGAGMSIAGYGAPAKATTLLNYCGIGTDLVDFTVDLSPAKQGRFIPGSHIPIYAPDAIVAAHPDRVWIFPWNLRAEIESQMSHIGGWGGRFLVRAPGLGLVS